ncbi:gluconokinase [Microbacterium sp. 179-B 1A2 NHS]|uniref:gluconokinase n=1 Tax=Microbacterium sp. 179-B 1A2 NHS TaxID=3142383 RepID=UPI0039A2FDA6
MGPSGSGKSVAGAGVATRLQATFVDADDLHPAANIEKMAAGIPLTDADREPWLDVVGAELAAADGIVVACSALRRSYRDRIRAAAPDVRFVELVVDEEELHRRMTTRAHFMPPALLASQLSTLEHLDDDEHGVQVDGHDHLEDVVAQAVAALRAG